MKKRILLIVLLVLIIILITTIILWPKNNNPQRVKVIHEIEGYGYVLEDDETKLYKEYFQTLIDTLESEEVDEEEYAKLVVKLFISDFYNLDNKPTKNDIGGLQYIHTEAKDNMTLKAKDTLYKYIESNIGNTRKQELPIVSDVKIEDISKIDFSYGKKKDVSAYEIKVNWTYKDDLGYQDEAILKLMHEDKKLSIVEIE